MRAAWWRCQSPPCPPEQDEQTAGSGEAWGRAERRDLGRELPGSFAAEATQSRSSDRPAGHPKTGRSTNSQQSRFSMSDGPVRENAIGNGFWGYGLTRRHRDIDPALAVPLELRLRERLRIKAEIG